MRGFSLRLSSWLPVRPGARLVREAGRQAVIATSSTKTNPSRSSCLTCRLAVGGARRTGAPGPVVAARGAAEIAGAAAAEVLEAGAVLEGGPGGPARAARRGRARAAHRGPS